MVRTARLIVAVALAVVLVRGLLALVGAAGSALQIASGTNALNVSIILGIMALPTVVSVSEDALQAAGRELREGSYALGATRAETLFKVGHPGRRQRHPGRRDPGRHARHRRDHGGLDGLGQRRPDPQPLVQLPAARCAR